MSTGLSPYLMSAKQHQEFHNCKSVRRCSETCAWTFGFADLRRSPGLFRAVRSVRRSMHAIEASLPMCCCRHRMLFCISILHPVLPGWLCARRALTHFNSITKHVVIARCFFLFKPFAVRAIGTNVASSSFGQC